MSLVGPPGLEPINLGSGKLLRLPESFPPGLDGLRYYARTLSWLASGGLG